MKKPFSDFKFFGMSYPCRRHQVKEKNWRKGGYSYMCWKKETRTSRPSVTASTKSCLFGKEVLTAVVQNCFSLLQNTQFDTVWDWFLGGALSSWTLSLFTSENPESQSRQVDKLQECSWVSVFTRKTHWCWGTSFSCVALLGGERRLCFIPTGKGNSSITLFLLMKGWFWGCSENKWENATCLSLL